jgi:hypothetical protein
MNNRQKLGGLAALYEAAAYLIGIVGFLLVVNVAGAADPVEKVAMIVENQAILSMLHLIVYVAWGLGMVVLSLALYDRLKNGAPVLAQTASAFGLIWAGLIIASGMIYNIGMETVAALHVTDPAQAATVWLAVESVFTGLGGGNEIVGGIWVLLLSWAGLRTGNFSRPFNYSGLAISAAAILTVIPALGEIGGIVFGLGQIVWFIWLGMALLRSAPRVVLPSAPAVS